MKRSYSILAMLLITLTGCFEIVEEMDLKANGTGSYEYTLNFSQSRNNLNRIALLDSVNGYKVPQKADIESAINQLIVTARTIDGLGNVQHTADYDNYIFSFSVDFERVSALNDLVAEMKKKDKNPLPGLPEDHFKYDKAEKQYTRNGKYPIRREFEKMKKADKMIFEDATFISIFRCDTELLESSNEDARIAPNKKGLMLRYNVIDVVSEEKSIGNTIQLTK